MSSYKAPKEPCPACGKRSELTSHNYATVSKLLCSYYCTGCSEQFTLKPHISVRRALMAEQRQQWRETKAMHALWFRFCKRFRLDKGQGPWAYNGYDFMRRVRALEGRKAWRGLHVLSCDDSYYSSSVLVLIEHEGRTHYHGISVVVIPQCSGQPPCEFFLYEEHAKGVVKALQPLLKKYKKSKLR